MRLYPTPLATTLALLLCGQAVNAEEQALSEILRQDGPYIDIPEGLEVPTGPPSPDQIFLMADLDGDPTTVTDEETAMLAVLMQVLVGSTTPVQFQLDPQAVSDTQIELPVYGGL